jgi:rhodanese-related sulfurtransferase
VIVTRQKFWKGWVVCGPSLLALVFCLCTLAARADDGSIMSADEAWQRAEAGELTIIDVRTESEWDETGIPPDAKRASLFYAYGLPNIDFVDEVRDATGGDYEQPVALICAAGVRSALARALLEADGFVQVYDIGEGMLGSGDGPGWLARGLPVEDCGDCTLP